MEPVTLQREREREHELREGIPAGGSAPGLGTPAVVLIVVAAVAAALLGRFFVHRLDRNRIQAYVAGNGGELLDCQWRLLGPGWFGSRNARIYAIRYRDREGKAHSAFCKTSALAGVYLTEDRVEGA